MDQLRSLRVFVRVIAEGSFAGAARALDMAPAVVTRAVAELEAHLGALLLNRTTRRLALTEIGEAYLQHATRILADLDDADALAGAATKQPRGVVRVLCPPSFATHQLARHLPRFRANYPQVGLEVATPGKVIQLYCRVSYNDPVVSICTKMGTAKPNDPAMAKTETKSP